MPTYEEWNTALISYSLSGAPRGSLIYLGADDEAIARVGRAISEAKVSTSHLGDFVSSVRSEVVREGRVVLHHLKGRNASGEPKGVAFLAATVLAAYEMAESYEEDVRAHNYFHRLREVLQLEIGDSGRPAGMGPGYEAEAPLWEEWSHWLMENGFLPTAVRGEGGTKYINYPISQTLLRRADKDRLRRLFQEQGWTSQYDPDTLASRVRGEAHHLPNHLKDLLIAGGARYDALTQEIFDLFEDWQYEHPLEGAAAARGLRTRSLFAYLYRVHDPIVDRVGYHLYPREPRRWRLHEIRVRREDGILDLVQERPGWYMPLWEAGVQELNNGARCEIVEPKELDSLVLQHRDFWILVPDPENPESGVYASWGSPSLGEPFILLCKHELLPQLMHLREEHLLEWHGDSHTTLGDTGWIELRYCMAVSRAWDGVMIDHRELFDALRPRMSLAVSFSGGLHVSDLRGWLEEYGPDVTVSAFEPQAGLSILCLADNHTWFDEVVPSNRPILVTWPGPGDFLVRADCSGEHTERLVKVLEWEELPTGSVNHHEALVLGNYRVCGALIEPTTTSPAY